MTLEDFEKSLHESRLGKRSRGEGEANRPEVDDRGERRHHHHHRSSHRDSERGDLRHRDHDDRHRHKRVHQSRDRTEERHQKRRHRDEEDEHHEASQPKMDEEQIAQSSTSGAVASAENENQVRPSMPLKRDSWMEAPSAIDIDYVHKSMPQTQRRPRRSSASLHEEYSRKVYEDEMKRHLQSVREGSEMEKPEVDYTFGDDGSEWRIMKLKGVYRQAEEEGKPVEAVAIEKYGDLRYFDDAREEEAELDRRRMYGEGYSRKEKPTGELYECRRLHDDVKQKPEVPEEAIEDQADHSQRDVVKTNSTANATTILDATALNRLKAKMMKAKLRKAPDAEELEAEYNEALASFGDPQEPGVIILGAMENRMLAGGKRGEVKPVNTRKGREKGLVEVNEDMSIEDMLREERRTRGQQEGRQFAERISRDAKFDNDLDYMDENAERLAKRVQKSEINLKNMAISEFQKMNRILDNCPLCYQENTNRPPVAPVVSLATRVYLTLPTEPEISEGGACIVPIQHRTNLLECDEDEWEEIRNFMKCLTRMYHERDCDVVFYENAARPGRHPHAAMQAVPLPLSIAAVAPAFFKEAILASDEEWSQHKKIIDTLARAKDGLGKLAFRRSLVKEMPYFHVWFELDGGIGHIVEDEKHWPKGDLFTREIIGGMLDVEPDVIKRQGRWQRGGDRRVEGFKKRWNKFDWTRVLTEEQ